MTKISDLSALTGAGVDPAADVIPIVDDSEASIARNKKITVSQLLSLTYKPGGTDVAIADGGTGASTAATARTNLGATTVGGNVFTLTNPSAVTFLRVNADNTVTALDAAAFRTAIGAGTGTGSGDLLAANNLSDLANAATARTNLGASTLGVGIFTAAAISDLRALGLQVQAVPRTVSGTSDTAALTDAGGYIRCTSGSAVTATIPPNSSVAFPTGTVITYEQAGAGTVTLTAGSGVTLNSRGGLLALGGQYAVAQVKKVATDTWTVIGDVA